MSVDQVMGYYYLPNSSMDILVEEVKRLREQRKLLYDTIPGDIPVSMGIIGIGNEIEAGREEKMTIDEIIAHVDDVVPVLDQRKWLVAEIKRLRKQCVEKDEKIGSQNVSLITIANKLDNIRIALA